MRRKKTKTFITYRDFSGFDIAITQGIHVVVQSKNYNRKYLLLFSYFKYDIVFLSCRNKSAK